MSATPEDWRALFHSPEGERVLLAIMAEARLNAPMTTADPHEIIRWQAVQDFARWLIGQAEMTLKVEPRSRDD